MESLPHFLMVDISVLCTAAISVMYHPAGRGHMYPAIADTLLIKILIQNIVV